MVFEKGKEIFSIKIFFQGIPRRKILSKQAGCLPEILRSWRTILNWQLRFSMVNKHAQILTLTNIFNQEIDNCVSFPDRNALLLSTIFSKNISIAGEWQRVDSNFRNTYITKRENPAQHFQTWLDLIQQLMKRLTKNRMINYRYVLHFLE